MWKARGHCLTQYDQLGLAVFRRPEYVRPSELDDAVAHSDRRAVAEGEAACLINGARMVVYFPPELRLGGGGDKSARARVHFHGAGLLDLVHLREGDALDTLRDIDGEINLLLIDGLGRLRTKRGRCRRRSAFSRRSRCSLVRSSPARRQHMPGNSATLVLISRVDRREARNGL